MLGIRVLGGSYAYRQRNKPPYVGPDMTQEELDYAVEQAHLAVDSMYEDPT